MGRKLGFRFENSGQGTEIVKAGPGKSKRRKKCRFVARAIKQTAGRHLRRFRRAIKTSIFVPC
jgi:hypothetical protein